MNSEISGKSQGRCTACGAPLTFSVSLQELACEYCGTSSPMISAGKPGAKLALDPFLNKVQNSDQLFEVVEIKCPTCGASESFPAKLTAANCPFCAAPIYADQAKRRQLLRPQAVLPFAVSEQIATDCFLKWLKTRWFAPNDLVKLARRAKALKGVYLPFWSFDSDSSSFYTGQRGVNRTEWHRVRSVENGRSVTRKVARVVTDWFPVQGQVKRDFRDLLEPASVGLSREQLIELEPWDLERLEGFSAQFLAGFWSETYQIEPAMGFEAAKMRMQTQIEQDVRRDIGGDHQRIDQLSIRHERKAFRYLLLPVWLSSYHYRSKLFQFMVNARTGEVIGTRPLSWLKISLAVVAGLGVLGIIWFNYLR